MKQRENKLYNEYIIKKRQQINKEEQLQIINDFAMKLLHQTTIDEIVWLVAKSVIAKLGFLDCVVYLFDSSGKHLIQKAAHGTKNPAKYEILNPIIIKLGEGIVGTVARTGVPELIHNTSQDSRYIVDDSSRLSEITVPIIYENKVLGVIDSEHPEANAFTQNDLTILMTIAAMCSIKIVHAQALQNLQNHKLNLEKEIEGHTKHLVQTINSLEKSNQDLERFAFAASHDMREPLRTIISYLQLIERKENSLSDNSLEFLAFAVDGAKRMKVLLDSLLEYSRANNSNENYEVIELEDILRLVKADLHTVIAENNTVFVYQQLPAIFGDKAQIRQLFQNLISNAIKFQKANQQARIEITTKDVGGYCEISIKDNGLGIDADFHNDIFDLFKRLHTNQDYQGSGIGLSICRRIIERHNGDILLKSKEGEGSTFIFTLPKNADTLTF